MKMPFPHKCNNKQMIFIINLMQQIWRMLKALYWTAIATQPTPLTMPMPPIVNKAMSIPKIT
jgi:hypothetical protein